MGGGGGGGWSEPICNEALVVEFIVVFCARYNRSSFCLIEGSCQPPHDTEGKTMTLHII